MNTITTKISAWERQMGAVTFAEAGEFGTAIEIMARQERQENLQSRTSLGLWDRFMAAITFAEAGEPETATQIMDRQSRQADLRSRTANRKQADKRPSLRA